VQPTSVPPSSRRARVTALLLVLGAAGALILAGCGSVGFSEGSGNTQNGRQLFVEKCGSCHTLADAGTEAVIGPNLDDAFFQFRVDASGARLDDGSVDAAKLRDPDVESTVRQVVRGQIAYPITATSTGAPGMPADIVTGQDAEDVSTYVASVAGVTPPGAAPPPAPPPPPATPPPPGGDDQLAAGKAVFTANCGACHTLADAGTSGAVGPNLDELQPTEAAVQQIVTGGRGAMPAFGDRLSEDEIESVAVYVSTVAGG
jgi:cytochrome c6